MRWISQLLTALLVVFMGASLVSAQTSSATSQLRLNAAKGQEQATAGKVTINYGFTRAVSPTEDQQYTVVLRNDKNEKVLSEIIDKGVQLGKFTDVEGSAGSVFYVELTKRVPGRNVPVQINAFKVNVTAPTASPTPTPAGGTGGTGATGTTSDNCYKFANTLFGNNICAQDFLTRAYLWAVGIAIIGAAGMIIFAGYKYAVSRGNPSEVNNAREIIISTLVGLALLVLSYTILQYFGVRVVDTSATPTPSASTSASPTP